LGEKWSETCESALRAEWSIDRFVEILRSSRQYW